jgi:hypothetical protein
VVGVTRRIAPDVRRSVWQEAFLAMNHDWIQEGLNVTRSFVPPDVHRMRIGACPDCLLPSLSHSAHLTSLGQAADVKKKLKGHPAVAKRVQDKPALWLTRMTRKDISSAAPGHFTTKYAHHTLDLMETAAVVGVTMECEFDDPIKRKWLEELRARFRDAVTKHEAGELAEDAFRHPAYGALSQGPYDPNAPLVPRSPPAKSTK